MASYIADVGCGGGAQSPRYPPPAGAARRPRPPPPAASAAAPGCCRRIRPLIAFASACGRSSSSRMAEIPSASVDSARCLGLGAFEQRLVRFGDRRVDRFGKRSDRGPEPRAGRSGARSAPSFRTFPRLAVAVLGDSSVFDHLRPGLACGARKASTRANDWQLGLAGHDAWGRSRHLDRRGRLGLAQGMVDALH